jgi:hypothetical protein
MSRSDTGGWLVRLSETNGPSPIPLRRSGDGGLSTTLVRRWASSTNS